MSTPIPTELLAYLEEQTEHEGPFREYHKDKPVMEALTTWVQADWDNLRLLLNYAYERGEMRALQLAQMKVADVLANSTYRHESLHTPDLKRGRRMPHTKNGK